MKHLTFFIALCLAPLFVCCGEGENSQLKRENDSVMSVNRMQAQILNDMTETLAEVSSSLDSISVGEGLLKKGPAEGNKLSKQAALESLRTFKGILSENRAKLANLQDKLADRNDQLGKLGKVIMFLNQELDAKETRIQQLEQELSQKNVAIVNLQSEIGSLNTTIGTLEDEKGAIQEELDAQKKIGSTVYYAIGTSKELKAKGLLSGGVFAKKKVNYSSIDNSQLTQADKNTLTELRIPSKSAKLMTGHPDGSYTLEEAKGNCVLNILNKDRFWSNSNILIIVTK